jgi:membrane-bound serine protease (ClpP class)
MTKIIALITGFLMVFALPSISQEKQEDESVDKNVEIQQPSESMQDSINQDDETLPNPSEATWVLVEGMIDNGLVHYIDRAIAQAEERGDDVIVFELDTFGGLVDAADKIRQSILDANIRTIAFINKNAASAGALISYACDEIVMAEGASIGAATVVEGQSGEKASEKMQSYFRGLMRSTAEANGRDPRIAEAMVDESIEVEGVIEEGKLLTLSASEALEYGVADDVVDNKTGMLAKLSIEEEAIVETSESWEEATLRFIANPVVSGILMLMMMSGLYFEFQTPGFGFGGAAAAVGAAMFFAPLYIMGLAEAWEILLFALGVILLIVEIFVIPGFGVPGILGFLLVVFSLGASLIGNVGLSFPEQSEVTRATWTMAITLSASFGAIALLARAMPERRAFGLLVLNDKLTETDASSDEDEYKLLLGQEGVAKSPLRPSGVVDFSGRRMDVQTLGDFIESGETVVVKQVNGHRVLVERKG